MIRVSSRQTRMNAMSPASHDSRDHVRLLCVSRSLFSPSVHFDGVSVDANRPIIEGEN